MLVKDVSNVLEMIPREEQMGSIIMCLLMQHPWNVKKKEEEEEEEERGERDRRVENSTIGTHDDKGIKMNDKFLAMFLTLRYTKPCHDMQHHAMPCPSFLQLLVPPCL